MKLFIRNPTEKHNSVHVVNEDGEFITDKIKDIELGLHYQHGAFGMCEVFVEGWYEEKNCGSCKHAGKVPYCDAARYCWINVPEWVTTNVDLKDSYRVMTEDGGTTCECWEKGTHESFREKPWPVSPFEEDEA